MRNYIALILISGIIVLTSVAYFTNQHIEKKAAEKAAWDALPSYKKIPQKEWTRIEWEEALADSDKAACERAWKNQCEQTRKEMDEAISRRQIPADLKYRLKKLNEK